MRTDPQGGAASCHGTQDRHSAILVAAAALFAWPSSGAAAVRDLGSDDQRHRADRQEADRQRRRRGRTVRDDVGLRLAALRPARPPRPSAAHGLTRTTGHDLHVVTSDTRQVDAGRARTVMWWDCTTWTTSAGGVEPDGPGDDRADGDAHAHADEDADPDADADADPDADAGQDADADRHAGRRRPSRRRRRHRRRSRRRRRRHGHAGRDGSAGATPRAHADVRSRACRRRRDGRAAVAQPAPRRPPSGGVRRAQAEAKKAKMIRPLSGRPHQRQPDTRRRERRAAHGQGAQGRAHHPHVLRQGLPAASEVARPPRSPTSRSSSASCPPAPS